MKGLIALGVILIAGVIVLAQSLYVVDVTEQVLVLRFGEVVGLRPNPGLYVKAPFIDTVVRYEKRVLRIDAPPTAMPDIEKENLVIDSYARYRITDPVQFPRRFSSKTPHGAGWGKSSHPACAARSPGGTESRSLAQGHCSTLSPVNR